MRNIQSKALDHIGAYFQHLHIPKDIIEVILLLVSRHADPIALMRLDECPKTHYSFAAIARLLYKSAIQRNALLGNRPLHDGEWLMLLDLFAAMEEGRPIAISSLCIASGKPVTTALRHIHEMVENGIILRKDDPHDRRRVFVELSALAYDGMRRVIQSFAVPRDLLTTPH